MQAGDFLAEYDLDQYVMYRCVVGSKAYGLDDEHSDIVIADFGM